MDIKLTEEQELLQSSVQRLLRDQYDFDARRKILASEDGFSRKQWEAFAELGLLGAPLSEEVGGLGGGPLSTMIVDGVRRAEAGADPRYRRRQGDLGAGLDRKGLALRLR